MSTDTKDSQSQSRPFTQLIKYAIEVVAIGGALLGGNELWQYYSSDTIDEGQFTLVAPDETTNEEALENLKTTLEFDGQKDRILGEEIASIQELRVDSELALLFRPERFSCPLPDKIKKKIDKKKDWAPSAVSQMVRGLPGPKALRVDGASISVLLHTVKLKPLSGPERDVYALNSPTYKNLSVNRFIDTQRNQFAYSLDCSGFLTAAMSLSANASAADLQTSANTSLESTRSLMIGRASIFSPLLVALRPNQFPDAALLRVERLGILAGLCGALSQCGNQDSIVASMELDLLWTTNSGDSRFNGEGKLTAGAGVGFGVAQIDFRGSAGGQLTRSSSFTSYTTYILNRSVLPPQVPIAVKDVRTAVEQLTSSSALVESPVKINNDIVVVLELPKSLCELNWSLKGADAPAHTTYEDGNRCTYRFATPTSTSLVNSATLSATGDGLSLERIVRLP